ncbi:adenosylcobinamide-GDP ribazoletransferase [Dietzia cinnamea]|uniref:Adenosylcobinamide-GDP ribazoletransferase n=1 Tax=Dietzia cinnamea TaxID=321318 RepID=A0A4R3ZZF2_9ACTN|nr:adenosylcobinamide-GDP ribazoletransferase [Dietzia cinnamea]MCT2275855.1 adenosylcobinamide-GDP ribazoletransferase [Dietzia cinnamea]TCW26603.1 cobalamin-5'-phosphate synthase [Dietzia cinnamea]
MIDAVRLSLSWMTVIPVGRGGVPDATAAGRAMTALPAVGLVCGATATALAHGAHALGAGAMLSGVVGVGAVLALTRGMHVDALADTADGLGSYAGPDRALEIMRSGSVGPMGAAVLVLVLLAEVAALGALVGSGAWLAPVAAFVLSRCLPVVLLRRGVPAASSTGFGALVAGSQSRVAVAMTAVLCAVAGAGLAGGASPADRWWAPVVGAAAGLLAYATAAGFGRHVVRRFGGVNGDVLGAVIEAGTAAALVAAVLLA